MRDAFSDTSGSYVTAVVARIDGPWAVLGANEEFNTNGTRQSLTRGLGFADRAEHGDARVCRASRIHGTSYIDERAVLHDDGDVDEE